MIRFGKNPFPPLPAPTAEDPLPGMRGEAPRIPIPRVAAGPHRKILVRMPNWVGDVVMALPALRALRESCAGSRITILIKPRLFPIIASEPYFDDWIPYRARGLAGIRRFGHDLGRRRFDAALILPNSISSALAATFARIPVRVGYDLEWRRIFGLLTHALPARKRWGLRLFPMVDYYLTLTYAIGCPPASRRIEFHIPSDLAERRDRFFEEAGVGPGERVIGISPGAAFGRSKQWRSDHFAEVADTLGTEYGAKILILCGPEEEGVANEIEEAMKGPAINTSRRIVPLDLLKAVVGRCMLLVTTDSGTRHFAVGTGVPVITVLGPTFHIYTEVEFEKYDIVQHRLDCWPCHRPACPVGHHRCMNDLPPETVLTACRRLLARFPPP